MTDARDGFDPSNQDFGRGIEISGSCYYWTKRRSNWKKVSLLPGIHFSLVQQLSTACIVVDVRTEGERSLTFSRCANQD